MRTEVKLLYMIDGETKDFAIISFPDDPKATKEFFTYCRSKGIQDSMSNPMVLDAKQETK
jgi:hypothetical protein